jgi:glycosyltransferase involved in cell wall biosynthesis
VVASSKIRVLHVIDSLGVSGGSERQLINNLIRFSDPHIEHRVAYLFSYPLDAKAALIPPHIHVECLFSPQQRWRGPLRAARRIRRLARSWQADIIHCSLAQASLASRIAGRLSKVPVVQTLVNVGYEAERLVDNQHVSRWKLEVLRTIDRVTMRWVVRFHAVSQTVAESWSRTVGIPRVKIEVIPRGVDPQELEAAAAAGSSRQELLASLNLSPDALILLSVGRHEPQKGQRYLLEALSSLKDVQPPPVLLIAGRTGTLTPTLISLARELGVEGSVRFLGNRDDVPALLRTADLFVFPSLHEGMPGALLEAMAMGCACVASDIGPAREVIIDGSTGVMVPPRDSRALAEAISHASMDIEFRRSLGRAASEYVRLNFSAQDAATRLEQLYRNTLRAVSSA